MTESHLPQSGAPCAQAVEAILQEFDRVARMAMDMSASAMKGGDKLAEDVMHELTGIPQEIAGPLSERLRVYADNLTGVMSTYKTEVINSRRTIANLESHLAETQQLVMTDPLTGAVNRRGMDQELKRASNLLARNGKPFSVIMIDIDHFKKVNDSYGHPGGDQVLVYVARALKSTLRESDLLARYGGEEFMLLLPETQLRGAVYLVDRIRDVVSRNPAKVNGKRVPVTFSAGIAEAVAGEPLDLLVARADNALYSAKQTGRNRYCVSASRGGANQATALLS